MCWHLLHCVLLEFVCEEAWINGYIEKDWGKTKEVEPTGVPKWFNKSLILSTILLVVSGLIIIFVPNRETMYQMMVARIITPDNIGTAIGAGKDVLTFIKDLVRDLITQTVQGVK